ncbi:MAG: glutathione S-transferase family protein [Pseudomonadota bacterium]
MAISVHGYKYSVYTRIVRATLAEKALAYEYVEVNPFDPDMDRDYLLLQPFKRVPYFEHDGFGLYETAAITAYIDETFPGTRLQPDSTQARARMRQMIGIIDAYGFKPMMLDVFSNRIVAPLYREPIDVAAIESGLQESQHVLQVLHDLMEGTEFLCGDRFSLADLHLAPIMDYFLQVEEGQQLVAELPALDAWWRQVCDRESIVRTRPVLANSVV